ncbi:HdeD family acid-resistance protein [Lutibacter holmesii]|uniref:HdeD family acid-resistance protein n=1 Tax=Lutibacter holmesii TaxID=1137985 RepID=A0ABW3WLM2_9FLAO
MKTKKIITSVITKSFKSIMILGILMAILGVVAMVYPEGFGKVSVTAIGIFMIIGGVLRLLFAITSFSMGSLLTRYLYGILMIVGGAWVVGNPDMGLEALTFVMAIYFIVDGLTQLVYSFSLIPIGGGMYLLFSGIIGIGLGVLVFMNWPEASTYVIGIYLGVKLLIDGVTLALTGKAVYKTAQLQS